MKNLTYSSDISDMIYDLTLEERQSFIIFCDTMLKSKNSEWFETIKEKIISINTFEEKQKLEESAAKKGKTTINIKDWGVHITHCCFEHGCKYGDVDCPVELGLAKQEYPCEWCK